MAGRTDAQLAATLVDDLVDLWVAYLAGEKVVMLVVSKVGMKAVWSVAQSVVWKVEQRDSEMVATSAELSAALKEKNLVGKLVGMWVDRKVAASVDLMADLLVAN